MAADLEHLAYESALRALDKQERLVEELRARTGIVLAASSVVVTYMGHRDLASLGSHGLALLAVVCFAVSVCAAVFVLLPSRGLIFAVRWIGKSDDPLPRVTGELFGFWRANDEAIRRLDDAFSLATIALGAEVLALVVLLGGTIV